MFPYNARVVITATVTDRFPTPAIKLLDRMWPTHESQEWVTLENVELLAGDPIWLMDSTHTKFSDQFAIHVMIHKEEARGKLNVIYNVNPEHGGDRLNTFGFDNCLFPGDADVLQPGRRVLLVLRNDAEEHYVSAPVEEQEYYPSGLMHVFVVGDDTLIDWWPYFVDITDLPEDWLEQEEFADLRELIQVNPNGCGAARVRGEYGLPGDERAESRGQYYTESWQLPQRAVCPSGGCGLNARAAEYGIHHSDLYHHRGLEGFE